MFQAAAHRLALSAALFLATASSPSLAAQQAQAPPSNAAVLESPRAATKSKPEKKPAAGVQTPAAQTASRGPQKSGSGQSIVALVNDEPVTAYEIQQRAQMIGGGDINAKAQANFQAIIKDPKTTERLKAILGETIKANPGKSKDEVIEIFDKRKKEFGQSLQRQAVEQARAQSSPGARKQALEELIDEKLKLQEAKRLNVVVAEDEVTRVINGIMERNKMTAAQFTQQLGGSLDPMKARIRSSLSWNELVRRRFGAQVTVSSSEVDKFVATGAASAEDQAELQLQRIKLALPAKLDQGAVAQRVQDAEKIRAKFTDCKSSSAIATGVAGAKFEELGKKRPSGVPEPTRSMLLNAADGEMLPPSVGDGGVELWIVCGRTVIKAEEQKRDKAEGELRQKEFDLLAKRHLKDLRQDAHIEYR
ncbi:MAG: SurA N-terminal domain-containing protein [Hyphomicrobium sp.]